MLITDYVQKVEQALMETNSIESLKFLVNEAENIDKEMHVILEQQTLEWSEKNEKKINECRAKLRYLFHKIESFTNQVTETLDYKNAFSDLCWQIHTERQNIEIYKSENRIAIEDSYERVIIKPDNNVSRYYEDVITEKLSSEDKRCDDW